MTRRELFSRVFKAGIAVAAAPLLKWLPQSSQPVIDRTSFAFYRNATAGRPFLCEESIRLAARQLADDWDKRAAEAAYGVTYGRN